MIRLPIPPLTEERRKEMVKQLHSKTEEARISVRNARRHAMDELKKALRAHDVSEDDERRGETEIERLTHERVEQLEAFGKEKETELLQV
jgi:ribosome recycling factor